MIGERRVDGETRARKRRLELETQYWELLLSGVGTFQACEIVGIGRKTGYRWRAENGGLPQASVAYADRSVIARRRSRRLKTVADVMMV